MAHREEQDHLEARLRALEAEAERMLTEAEARAVERRRRRDTSGELATDSGATKP